jgi:hypothetical protein
MRPSDALVHPSLGLHPPQDMEQDRELSSAVTDDHQVERKAL